MWFNPPELDHVADGQLSKPNFGGVRIATSLKTSDIVTILLLAVNPKANRPPSVLCSNLATSKVIAVRPLKRSLVRVDGKPIIFAKSDSERPRSSRMSKIVAPGADIHFGSNSAPVIGYPISRIRIRRTFAQSILPDCEVGLGL